jgi:hypothetical protein
VIAPHPGLTPAQAQAITMDYGLRGGRAGLKPAPTGGVFPTTTVRVRRALLFYALRRLGLDAAGEARPASEQHIVLVNRAEVGAALGVKGGGVRAIRAVLMVRDARRLAVGALGIALGAALLLRKSKENSPPTPKQRTDFHPQPVRPAGGNSP